MTRRAEAYDQARAGAREGIMEAVADIRIHVALGSPGDLLISPAATVGVTLMPELAARGMLMAVLHLLATETDWPRQGAS